MSDLQKAWRESWFGDHIGQLFLIAVITIAVVCTSFKCGYLQAVGSTYIYKVEHHPRYETIIMEIDGELQEYNWFYSDN